MCEPECLALLEGEQEGVREAVCLGRLLGKIEIKREQICLQEIILCFHRQMLNVKYKEGSQREKEHDRNTNVNWRDGIYMKLI